MADDRNFSSELEALSADERMDILSKLSKDPSAPISVITAMSIVEAMNSILSSQMLVMKNLADIVLNNPSPSELDKMLESVNDVKSNIDNVLTNLNKHPGKLP